MGVTIHYSASLKSPGLLPDLCEEIAVLSREAGWTSTSIGPDPISIPDSDAKIAEGILLNMHPEMEPVNLIFDDTGKMVDFMYLCTHQQEDPAKPADVQIIVVDESGKTESRHSREPIDQEILTHWSHTKTQFAGPLAHIGLCRLLRYLEHKYFKSIQVDDEGGYWSTGNVEELTKRMNFLSAAIDDLQLFAETRLSGKSLDTEEMVKELEGFWKYVIDKQKPSRSNS